MYFLRSDYSYEFPPDLIAHFPQEPRDHSRLMVIDRKTEIIDHLLFKDIKSLLSPQDQLVLNDTRVIPARVMGQKVGGGKVELFFLKEITQSVWQVMVKPSRKLTIGSSVEISSTFRATVIGNLGEGIKIVQCESEIPILDALFKWGQIPLSPYIKRKGDLLKDEESYQTIFGKKWGAVAAPTAGLHFTDELIADLEKKGVEKISVTLHIGLGTFKPLRADDIRAHEMHSEWCEISKESAERLNCKKGRRLCVGTSSCRTLESMATKDGFIQPGCKETSLFIYPGYQFKSTDLLLTNFHWPESTLLVMVSAFAGCDLIRKAYRIAIQNKYRFFSYGDAMLII